MKFTPIVLLSLAALAPMAPASAADMSRAPVIYDQSMIPQEVGTGWYLRGDVAYSFNKRPDIDYAGTALGGNSAAPDTWLYGAGFGYRFNEFMRGDLTVDRFGDATYNSSATCALWTTTDCADTSLATRERTKVQTWAIMLNGYADLGNWEGLTPYVGAGVGFAHVSVGHSSLTEGLSDPSRNFSSPDHWSLAAAAMAGVSYTVTNGLDLDVGYRFMWIDDAKSGGEASGNETGHISLKDMTAHQVRVGLRYYPF